MRAYTLITLNMIEYSSLYLKKQSAEYARILDVSDAVHSIKLLYKLLSSYRDKRIQNTDKHSRWSVLQKEQYLSAGIQTVPPRWNSPCHGEGTCPPRSSNQRASTRRAHLSVAAKAVRPPDLLNHVNTDQTRLKKPSLVKTPLSVQ